MSEVTDLGATLEQSRSGLRDGDRRSIMRLLFTVTGSALVVFACLQMLNGYWWLAATELAASAVLFFGVFRLRNTACLQQWVYAYLVTL
ncbi:MAG TPA: GGDEF domain-containing protein, partial [Marinobacter sp.]|nr:GGDEF domain-containing protein [Marinobacter sp.]